MLGETWWETEEIRLVHMMLLTTDNLFLIYNLIRKCVAPELMVKLGRVKLTLESKNRNVTTTTTGRCSHF